jgi:hypothetical protein
MDGVARVGGLIPVAHPVKLAQKIAVVSDEQNGSKENRGNGERISLRTGQDVQE